MTLFPCVEHKSNTGDKPKIVFVAGFPDNETSAWGKHLPNELSKHYDLFFLCFPGYEYHGTIQKWGYSFEELIDSLDMTLAKIYSGCSEKYTLICHDWGAFLGLLYQTKHFSKIEKLVLFEVGMSSINSIGYLNLFRISLYQLWFAVAFILSQLVSMKLGTLFMSILLFPIFRPLLPCTDKPPVPDNQIHAGKCYPYFYLWKDLLQLKEPHMKFPPMPTFYMVCEILVNSSLGLSFRVSFFYLFLFLCLCIFVYAFLSGFSFFRSLFFHSPFTLLCGL
jgi:pimeloyl-ACP methyl ester carboxylesterase